MFAINLLNFAQNLKVYKFKSDAPFECIAHNLKGKASQLCSSQFIFPQIRIKNNRLFFIIFNSRLTLLFMVDNKAFHNAASQFKMMQLMLYARSSSKRLIVSMIIPQKPVKKISFAMTYSRREVITFSDFVSSRSSSMKLLCELFERSSSLCNNSNNNNRDAIHEHEPCQPELKTLEPFSAQREAESI